MPSHDIVSLYTCSDALGLADAVKRGQVTPQELTETAIGLIETLDPALNAVVIRGFERARAFAQPGRDGVFAGVPYLLKNIASDCVGLPLTAGLSCLRDRVCQTESELVRRLKAAGLVILGRTNVPENGWCIATEDSCHGPTRNPWDPTVTPGGSSGGAAAAVAARMVPMAEATDGAGSIRVPASCCGLVGLKPSRGRITYGPAVVDVWMGSIAFFALTRTVRDTAALLDATAGPLTGDPYTPPCPQDGWLSALGACPPGLRIGVVRSSPWGPPIAGDVGAAVDATALLLGDLGHTVEEHRVRFDGEAAWHHYIRMNAVQAALDFDTLPGLAGRPVALAELNPVNRALVERGRATSGTEHGASLNALRQANRAVQLELEPYDVVLTPTLTQPPRPVGYWTMQEPDLDRYHARWADAAFMMPFNLSGLPAMSLPAAETPAGVPIGVQLVGRYGDDGTVLQLAAQIEAARPWAHRRPKLGATA